MCPDQAELHFTLSGILPTIEQVEDYLQRQRALLLEALAGVRISSARTTADGPVINPHHEYENHVYVFKGFKVTERICCRFDLEPGLVNLVLRAVAQQLSHLELDVRFTARRTGPARRAARAEAVREAQRKATHFASAAGHQLGRLLTLSDTAPLDGSAIFSRGQHDDEMACDESMPVEIDPESHPITAQIYAVWELAPTPASSSA